MAKKISGEEVVVESAPVMGEEVVVKASSKFKAAPSEKRLVVVAPFEVTHNFQTVQFAEGEEFVAPEGWTRDTAFEEFRKINTKDNPNGIAFSVPKPVLDEKGKLRYMDSRRVLLPLKEE